MISSSWLATEDSSYFRTDPFNPNVRWNVMGLPSPIRYYWFTTTQEGRLLSSYFGPFTNLQAAMADCEVANRPLKESRS